MTTTAQVVLVRFKHYRSAYYRVGANKLDLSVIDIKHRNTIFTGLNVTYEVLMISVHILATTLGYLFVEC